MHIRQHFVFSPSAVHLTGLETGSTEDLYYTGLTNGRGPVMAAAASTTDGTTDQLDEDPQDKQEVTQSDKVLYSLESILDQQPQPAFCE